MGVAIMEGYGGKMTDIGFTLAYTNEAALTDKDLPRIAQEMAGILNRGGIPTAISKRSRLPDPISISPVSGFQEWDPNNIASLRLSPHKLFETSGRSSRERFHVMCSR